MLVSKGVIKYRIYLKICDIVELKDQVKFTRKCKKFFFFLVEILLEIKVFDDREILDKRAGLQIE